MIDLKPRKILSLSTLQERFPDIQTTFFPYLQAHRVYAIKTRTLPGADGAGSGIWAQNESKDTLLHLIQDRKKGKLSAEYKITLMDVGLVIEYLMGGTFRCSYTKKRFKAMYKLLNQNNSVSASNINETFDSSQRREKTRHNHFLQTAQPFKPKDSICENENLQKPCTPGTPASEDDNGRPFHYPFNDLLLWAVLMKRQKMALFFWQCGEESMAKALVAKCLYQAMSSEARQWNIFDDTADKLTAYSKEFGALAVELLDKTYKQNEIMTMKLLTYQLSNWSNLTCLKLAVSGKLRIFVSHACTQKLLTDIWNGRLNLGKHAWFKVISSILLPPIIPLLEYKSKAQMSHIPVSQHAHEMILKESLEVKFSTEGGEEGARTIHKEAQLYDEPGENIPGMKSEEKPHRLALSQKYFAFYHAPIVKFWFNTVAYLAFLMLYTYVVLVKMESMPSVQEWIVFSFIVTTAVEMTREIFISEAGKTAQKLKVWLCSYFNVNELLAILTFLIGFCLRFGSRDFTVELSENFVFIAGRIIYCLNTIFWYVKLTDLLIVSQEAGPYVFMIGKMLSKMIFLVVIMGIVVVSFGVPKQGILHPNEEPSWSLAKAVVFRPYWMTYGEMFAYEIDACANDSVTPQLCITGSWLNGFLQAVYVFVQYIIMVNLLIAIITNVFKECKAISDHLWKFQRYYFVMRYDNKPVLPPPFILLGHLASVANWLCGRRKTSSSKVPKLFLTEEDNKRLHEFEEECVQIYFKDKKDDKNSKSDEKIRVTSERVEDMFEDMKDVRDHVNSIKDLLHHLDDHLGHLQDLSGLTLDSMKTLTAQKAMEFKRSHSMMSCDSSFSKQTIDDGLGQSTTWKKSRSRHILAHSFSQPHQEKYSKTLSLQQRISGSDFSPVYSAFPQFQHGAFCDNNTDYGKDKSLKSRPDITLETLYQNSSSELQPMEVPEVINVSTVVQSKKNLIQVIPKCPELVPSALLGKAYKEEGFLHCIFTDDDSKAIYEKDSGDGGPYFKISSELKAMEAKLPSPEVPPNDDSHGAIVKKLSKQYKSPGNKAPEGNQTYSEIALYHKEKDHLRRSHSCTKLKELQQHSPVKSINQSDLDGRSMSCEDLHQTNSTAALLQEQYNSRYSSTNTLPIPKDSFTKSGCNFRTSMDTSFYYSAIERNNLYRLSQSIPFTPLPPVGELITVYRLEESAPITLNNSMSSWSHDGFYAAIEVLSKKEMGGGLRKAVKVLCTWSQNDTLKPGHLYIIKSFLPEVVNTWSEVYKAETVLELCLREIQQQRAAQKLLYAFNQRKPKTIAYAPRFLEVFLLYCHSVRQWFTVEEYMAGKFRKYNNNTGSESVPTNKLEKTMLAFSHWTYEYTRGEYLVLDLQGVGENLTDPSVIKAGEHRSQELIFGPANLGDEAILNFCTKHQCNAFCRYLRLPEMKSNEYITDKVLQRRKSQVCGTEAQANNLPMSCTD